MNINEREVMREATKDCYIEALWRFRIIGFMMCMSLIGHRYSDILA